MKAAQTGKTPKVLVIDVGGTNVKLLATGQKEPRKYPSGPTMTPQKMVQLVKKSVSDWKIRLYLARVSGPDHQWASASRTAQPWTRMGRIQFSESVWMSGESPQRRRHASGWQLSGRPDAVSRTGNGLGIRDDRRRDPAAHGAGAPRLQKRQELRGLSWFARASNEWAGKNGAATWRKSPSN